jgi:UDP-2-acetamido-3-amino-2,3-dideoxy-glucuronate N-acetyltransferase
MFHPLADIRSKDIGDSTNIWQFCVVLEGAKIGNNCNICANVFIENEVYVGNNVTIKNQVQLWDGVTIEDGVFIGPNVTFSNDKYPRSKSANFSPQRTTIHMGASIGAAAVILPNISIGRYAMIGAGSVITKDVSDFEIWYGNPARLRGYVCKCGTTMSTKSLCGECDED